MNQDMNSNKISQANANPWADGDFKQTLLVQPEAPLHAEGVELPAARFVQTHENTDKVLPLVISALRTKLSDADLDSVSGGAFPTAVNDQIT